MVHFPAYCNRTAPTSSRDRGALSRGAEAKMAVLSPIKRSFLDRCRKTYGDTGSWGGHARGFRDAKSHSTMCPESINVAPELHQMCVADALWRDSVTRPDR